MRRISLAVALVGAVAAAGCGGGAKPGASGSKGTAGVNFTVTVNNQGPGTVTSSVAPTATTDSANPCAANTPCTWTFKSGTTVVLTGSPATGNFFNGWFGACNGTDACTLTGDADQYVVAYFSAEAQAHPNWAHGWDHGPRYEAWKAGAGAYDCGKCHGGPSLIGSGIAPACNLCHYFNGTPGVLPSAPSAQVAHFDSNAAPWGDHNGWTQDCQRCHTNQGFRDYIGVDKAPGEGTASDDRLTGTFKSTNTLTSTTAACVNAGTCNPDAYAYGPLKCDTCHNAALFTGKLTQLAFASSSAATPTIVKTDPVTGLCAQCHQARETWATIEAKIAAKNLTVDQKGTGFSFLNPHYLGAAATMFGGEAAGWVQYTGNVYTGANQHGGAAACNVCHDPHNGELPQDWEVASRCGKCHFKEGTTLPVTTMVELEETRQYGFEGDIDGDGAQKSVKLEIDGLAAKLYVAMQAYASNVLSAPITYTDNYPYYMGADGKSYTVFSPRLQRAAVNYKWYKADPGAWAHNPRYAIEIIYDSIADLNVALAPLGKQVSNGKRAFNGHFGAGEDPSAYAAMIYHGGANAVTGEVLPTMGFTSDACYQCHGGKVGFDTYLTKAPAAMPAMTTNNAAKVTAIQCSTCHTFTGADMKGIRNDVATVYFPPQKNGATNAGQVSFAAASLPKSFAVCGTCHSGRENGATINVAITTGGKNAAGTTVAPATDTDFVLGFKNPHYLGAAGMMLGSSAGVMYQYSGKSYATTPAFWSLTANGPHGSPHGAACTGCHNPQGSAHTFEIKLDKTVVDGTFYGAQNTKACSECHAGQYSLAPKITEFEEAAADLYAAIQAYASAPANLAAIKASQVASKQRDLAASPPKATQADVDNSNAMTGICYVGAANPYFFVQTAAGCSATSFAAFNPKLLEAAYNYQWTQKEPGAWAHNEFYVMQAIYDSIVDLGGTPTFKVAAVMDTTVTPNVPKAGDPLNRGY